MTSFLVRHKELSPFSPLRNPAEEAPLAGCKEARGLLLRPLVTRTERCRCESAKAVDYESLL